MSDITKKKRLMSRITFWLSVALNVVPLIVFAVIGFAQGETSQKIVLSFMTIAAIVLGLLMIITKLKIQRSVFWIVFLCIYLCMDKMLAIIISMGLCTIIDELLVSPIHKRFNTDYHTHKEIDKRL